MPRLLDDESSVYDWEDPTLPENPERNLIATLLSQAIMDLIIPSEMERARLWIFDREPAADSRFTFLQCCAFLNIEADDLRSSLRNRPVLDLIKPPYFRTKKRTAPPVHNLQEI